MATVGVRVIFPTLFICLPACSRDFPTHEQARRIVTSCGLTVTGVEDAYGFDFGGIEVDVKHVSDQEFIQKKDCAKWQFFFKGLDISYVIIENGGPKIPDWKPSDLPDEAPTSGNLVR
jgi:hypothetical protein